MNDIIKMAVTDGKHMLHDALVLIVVDIIHATILGIVIAVILQWWQRRKLKSGKDTKHIAFGVNHKSADGTLKLRYIGREASAEKVMENLALHHEFLRAVKNVRKNARKRPGYFIVEFPERYERKIMDTFRNYLSEGMRESILLNACNPASQERAFVIMVTDEYYDAEPEQMPRLIFTPLAMLKNLPEASAIKVEEPFQRDRMQTLAFIRERFAAMSEERKRRHIFNVPAGKGIL